MSGGGGIGSGGSGGCEAKGGEGGDQKCVGVLGGRCEGMGKGVSGGSLGCGK